MSFNITDVVISNAPAATDARSFFHQQRVSPAKTQLKAPSGRSLRR